MSGRPFGHLAFIGAGFSRVEAAPVIAPGHLSYIGSVGTFRTVNNMAATVERRERELLRRALWLNCERAPFERAHP